MEQVRSPVTLAANVPIAFPESYPFSLLATLPATKFMNHDISIDQPVIFNCVLAETAVVFLVLILSAPRNHIINFLESTMEIEGKDKFVHLLSRFFRMAISLLSNEAWPKSWLNIDILAHKVLLKMIDPIAFLLIRDFVPEQPSSFEFNATLWREAFYTILQLLSSDQLVIEDFSPQVRFFFFFFKARCLTEKLETSCCMAFIRRHPWRRCKYFATIVGSIRMARSCCNRHRRFIPLWCKSLSISRSQYG